jgi:hypothetical protein
MPENPILVKIRTEITADSYYSQFPNEGQKFVAWYLRRVLLRDPAAARLEITDGQNDKQIDALVVDEVERRIIVVQGKFFTTGSIDGAVLREVLGAWVRFHDLAALQKDANERLRERLEAVRRALDDDYEVEFELLTTGELSPAAATDFLAFQAQIEKGEEFDASLTLVDSDVLEARLADAEARDLPILSHTINLEPTKTISMEVSGTRCVVTALPLTECLTLPGIVDGRLFRKNVRQSLGLSNKVNKGIRRTLESEEVEDFFFYHNGVTALCREFELQENGRKLAIKDLSIVNGCQSITTIYKSSQRIRSLPSDGGHILFRFYEIPKRALADRISIFTNSQSAVKPRDLRSNDQTMLALKRAYDATYRDGMFVTQRGAVVGADKDLAKVIDCAEFAKAVMAWHCQRPNIAYNERRLFDEYYKTIFRSDYNPAAMLALQNWISKISSSWEALNLNEALVAGRSYVRHHILFSVSALISDASGQGGKVPKPEATAQIVSESAHEVLPLAARCLNTAMETAKRDADLAGRVFSHQNWCKTNASFESQKLVASTIIGMLPSLQGTALLQRLKLHQTSSSNVGRPISLG